LRLLLESLGNLAESREGSRWNDALLRRGWKSEETGLDFHLDRVERLVKRRKESLHLYPKADFP
jgi:hypothetical protein